MCPGEGTCALACIKKMLPFVGVAFTEQHSARLMAHLEKKVLTLSCMMTQGDPLYDVKFAEAVSSEARGVAAFSLAASGHPGQASHPGGPRPGREASET